MIDIRDASNPKRVGFLGTSARGVATFGDQAYIAAGEAGLLAIQASPANPQRTGRYEIAMHNPWSQSGVAAVSVAVSQNQCALATLGAGMLLIDTSNVLNPQKLGHYDTPGWLAVRTALVGKYAYVLESRQTGWTWESRLEAVDLSTPALPQRVGVQTIDGLTWASAFVVSGDFGFVAGSGSRQGVSRGRLEVFDRSNPARMQHVSGMDTGGGARDVAVIGGRAYVADQANGLEILDVANAASPIRVGAYDTGGEASGIAVRGNFAYVADARLGLLLLDVSNPANPVLVSSYPTDMYAQRITLSGNYAYLLGYALLQVIDISDPGNPREVGRNSTFPHGNDLAIAGDHFFVAAYDELAILDLLWPSGWLQVVPGRINDEFGVRVHGSAGQRFTIQRSTDLGVWQDWRPVTLGGGSDLLPDPDTTIAQRRFYRARQIVP